MADFFHYQLFVSFIHETLKRLEKTVYFRESDAIGDSLVKCVDDKTRINYRLRHNCRK